MNNFEFQNPTKLIFGKGTIAKLATEIPAGKKIMITFGGGSVKNNGVYDQVISALQDMKYIEFWGIEPNPQVATIRKAVELAQKEQVDFFLSVGGGSCLDATKVIAASACGNIDAWDMVKQGDYTGKSYPVASVMTLPATGSEMNKGSVISNAETQEKFPVYTYYPVFSILDPETTYSLPKHQVACGLTDTFVHVVEQYLTQTNVSPLMDRWAEGVLLTIKEAAPKIAENQTSYDNMANYMLSATMALNGFIAMGVPQDWATHYIGHEITALAGLTHGHTLSIVLPALMCVMRKQKSAKILQYGERVFDIKEGSDDQRIDATIAATENLFRSMGLKTRLSENGVGNDIIAKLNERFKERDVHFGENQNITYKEIAQIFELCK